MSGRPFPEAYEPLNFCRGCGRDFASVAAFDAHRLGRYEHDFSLAHPNGRRCADDEELAKLGLVRVKPSDRSKYASRLASGVPLYWGTRPRPGVPRACSAEPRRRRSEAAGARGVVRCTPEPPERL